MEFLYFLLALVATFLIAFLGGLLFWKSIVNLLVDNFVKRLLKDPYPENIGEMYNVFKKVGIQKVLESDLRGNCGLPLGRPFGSPIQFSQWDKLLFNPVYLSRLPVESTVAIDTQVVIGPNAKKPLYIDLPIMIGGMAYGVGLSYNAKLAIAKGADQVNTAVNSGVGPLLPDERRAVKRLILQYHRGYWGKDENVLRQADMIEIQMGYGALGAAPVKLEANQISEEFREFMKLKPGQTLSLNATLENVKDRDDLKKLVNYLRKVTNGVPIGVKIGATHLLEKEMEIMVKSGIDFLSLDGAEAGINFGPPTLADDLGLPALPALCRAVAFLEKHHLKKQISLILSGGLVTPGQFLKAIALGADAVYIGTIVMIVLAHLQLPKVIPWEPPTELVYEQGKYKDRLNIDEGAKSLANYLKSCNEEIMNAMRSIGRTSLQQLSKADLCAISEEVAAMTGVELGLFPPAGSRKDGA